MRQQAACHLDEPQWKVPSSALQLLTACLQPLDTAHQPQSTASWPAAPTLATASTSHLPRGDTASAEDHSWAEAIQRTLQCKALWSTMTKALQVSLARRGYLILNSMARGARCPSCQASLASFWSACDAAIGDLAACLSNLQKFWRLISQAMLEADSHYWQQLANTNEHNCSHMIIGYCMPFVTAQFLLQDPGAPAQWLAAAAGLLTHLAVMDPEAVQQQLLNIWGALAALLDINAVAARGSMLPKSLQRLQLLHVSPPGESMLSWLPAHAGSALMLMATSTSTSRSQAAAVIIAIPSRASIDPMLHRSWSMQRPGQSFICIVLLSR